MRDGWAEAALGDLCRLVTDRRDAKDVEGVPYVGLEHMLSGSPAMQAPGTTAGLASQVVAFKTNDILFGRLRPYLRKVARASFAGVCSPEILVLRPEIGRVLPGYLHALAASDSVIDWAVSASAGSRMPRTAASDLLGFRVRVPPLAEQRRIVDLITAVDRLGEQSRRALAAVETTQRVVLNDLFMRLVAEQVPVVEILGDVIGGVWGDPPGENEITVAALGLTAFNSPTASVDRAYSTPRSISRERLARRGLRAEDMVLERSGGTNDRPVGRVILAREDMTDVIPTDFMRLLRVDPSRAEPRYVFWWLWTRYQRSDTLAFQSQTTNIRNLRVTDYLGLPIPMPTRDAQMRLAAIADDLAGLADRARQATDAVASLRAALLADLLMGEHQIPPSYDQFIDGAA